MKKNIVALIIKIIIGIIILSCLITHFINSANDLVNNNQVVELVIGSIIGVGLVIARNLLDKEERE